jgi:phage baseplate assembly protein W
MAFGAKKIFPIDTKPSVAVGVSIPFNGDAVFNSTYTTKDAIRNNLINFFLTNPGERYLNVLFGGGLRAFIFEQITTGNLDFLKEDIQAKLALYFPSVVVSSLEVTSAQDQNQVFISLYYSIKDTGITDQIEIAFE